MSNEQALAADFLEMESLRQKPGWAGDGAAKVQALASSQPPMLPALLVSGLMQEKSGDAVAARATIEGLLKKFPLFAPAHESLARLLGAPPFNDTAKAYEHASKAREAFPNDPSVARLLGGLAFQKGEFSRATQLLTESAPSFPADAELYFDLGFAYQKLKQPAPSRAAFSKALELAPNSARASAAKQALSGPQ